ncbi:MAG: GNAT family N-acetyltransferase [Chloroflexi bacterium]|nr:GNAT family N-acetyltransferase [Chloroflexota bacterium]
MAEGYTIRRGTPADAHIVTKHRRLMFIDMGYTDPQKLDAMDAAFVPWVRERLARDEYLAWLAVSPEGDVVSSAGLYIREFPPHPEDMSERQGYILNVYTVPDYRRRGFAGQLVRAVVRWCRDSGINRVTLNYTEAGRPIYERLGFTDSNVMLMWAKDLVDEA